MKKIAKIIAAMSVAVAAFALVGCADGMTKEIKAAYAPDAPAAPEAPKAGTYYLNWSISNLDDYEDFMNSSPDTTISRVVTAIPAAEEGDDPTYRLSYTYDGSTYTVKQWKALYDLDIVDNTTSIEVTDVYGNTYTYKPLTDLKQTTGTTQFDLKSKTTDILGSTVAAPKTTTVTSTDTAKWNAIPAAEKTATITVTAATDTTPAVTSINWNGVNENQTTVEGEVIFSVDGDEITITMLDYVDTDNNGSTETPAVSTYVFTKHAQ